MQRGFGRTETVSSSPGTRRLHPCVHHDPEEAELGAPEGRACRWLISFARARTEKTMAERPGGDEIRARRAAALRGALR